MHHKASVAMMIVLGIRFASIDRIGRIARCPETQAEMHSERWREVGGLEGQEHPLGDLLLAILALAWEWGRSLEQIQAGAQGEARLEGRLANVEAVVHESRAPLDHHQHPLLQSRSD